VQVTVDTSNGTATTGDNDYQALHQVLTFAPGETSKNVTVRVTGDAKVEGNETFSVALSEVLYNGVATPASVDLSPTNSVGTGTVVNDDSTLVSIVPLEADKPEGNAGTTPLTFTVGLSQPSTITTTVNVDTADGTATLADNDYQALHQTLTFNPGETLKTVTVEVVGDTRIESDEAFTVNLSNVIGTGASLGAATSATGTIRNDDFGATVSIAPLSAANPEGNEGTLPFTFRVALSGPTTSTITVDVDTADGTATTAGNDYQALHQTVTFDPGETEAIVMVDVVGNTLLENDETFTVRLSNVTGTGASLGTAAATGTIRNDDGRVELGPGGRSLLIVGFAGGAGVGLFFDGEQTATYTVNKSGFDTFEIVGGAGDDELTLDFANDSPLPSEGLIFRGSGAVSGDSLVWKNTTQTVWMAPDSITTNATPPVRLQDVAFCTFSLADAPDDQVMIDGAVLRIKQDNGISSNAAVNVMGGGVLDLNGKTINVPSVTVVDGNVLNGIVYAGTYVVRESDNGSGVGISASLRGTSDATTLRKEDAGTTVLNGDNRYLGGTIVNNGTLLVNAAPSLPAGAPLSIRAGATVVLAVDMTQGTAAARIAASRPAVLETSSATVGRPVLAIESAPATGPSPDVVSGDVAAPAETFVASAGAVLSELPAVVLRSGGSDAQPIAQAAEPSAAAAPVVKARAMALDSVLATRAERKWMDDLAWLWQVQQPGAQRRAARQGMGSGDAVDLALLNYD
jgi:autotransporter-associated beta strand protein